MDHYMGRREAARYADVSIGYLMTQATKGKVRFIRPSPKKSLFRQADLDEWMRSWAKFEPQSVASTRPPQATEER